METLTARAAQKASDMRWQIEELHRELNSTILLVTHDEQTAASCERMLILRDGRVAEDHASVGRGNSTEAV